jgi:hypothetical protein
MANSTTATYLYCVVRSVSRPRAARVPHGLEGATAPEAHEAAPGLWLIAARVPLALYGPSVLETRLRDLDWVSRVALAHEAVVEHFARRRGAVVIPAKLFTMFSTLEKAVEDIARRRRTIERVMKRVAACEEWGIRVTRSRTVDVVRAGGQRPTSGAAFLAGRKAARDATAIARAEAAAAAERAYGRLARLARETRQREAQHEPGTNPPVLEAAFLVRSAARAAFKAEAKRQAAVCAAAGADLTLTGPWPVYNFIGTTS